MGDAFAGNFVNLESDFGLADFCSDGFLLKFCKFDGGLDFGFDYFYTRVCKI